MRLTETPFSAFPRATSLDDLLSRESVLVLDDQPASGRPPLHDGPDRATVLHLRDALLLPAGSLPGTRAPLPRPFRAAPAAHLLIAGPDRLCLESFMRPGLVPPGLRREADGTWHADLPEPAETVEGPVLFLDLLSAHFGHVILESTARLWVTEVPALAPLAALPGIGFSHQGLRSLGRDPQNAGWPAHVGAILGAAGMPPARIRVVTRPLRVRSLIVPRRLSPFAPGWGWGPGYRRLMAAAGRRLAAAASGTAAGFGPRLYLSRSRLSPGSRGLDDGQEAEVEVLMAARGFRIVHPQEHPLPDQIAMVRTASHVAGLQGSQLHLATFAADLAPRMFQILPSYMRKHPDAVYLDGAVREFPVGDLIPPGLIGNGHIYRMSEDEMARLGPAIDDWLAQPVDD